MSNEPKWGERKPRWYTFKPRPKSTYTVPMHLTTMLTEHLGDVQERADGRWNWWRYKAYFFIKWQTGQGVAPSKEQAMAKVLEGWD